MKVVIIGGGIAGLTLGNFLHKKNIEVVINERSAGIPIKGHAFLMNSDGFNILKELSTSNKEKVPGKKIDVFSLKRPEGIEIKHIQLYGWNCIKRNDIIRFLYNQIPGERIKEGREFSHFIYEKGKAIAACFLNGEIEYGDIFVGADGGNSKVRQSILGKIAFTPVQVKEIVGVCHNKKIVQEYSHIFTKYQDKTEGLAFGFIPTSDAEFVWFIQYDPLIGDLLDTTPLELRSFCLHLLKNFPRVVSEILESSDFFNSYIWNTRDFDLLPTFHKQNVVLIGDASHLALPFTSAGTTNAVIDAKLLADLIEYCDDCEKTFTQFYAKRSKDIAKHIQIGRELKQLFLNPQHQNDDDIPVPLIPNKTEVITNKEIQILYFTDPICSTCWIIQPLLRKLELEYGDYIHIEYRMGGLLPSWEEYEKRGGVITQPSDAAKHWEEVCALHDMPLDGDIWTEDPLPSSYPPSIAFKAAQMQDTSKAILFLRRIKEMVFLEKKNIIKWEFLENAAFEVGLDSARLLRDVEGKAKQLFKDDLLLAKRLGVVGFPTLFFSDSYGNKYTLKGYKPYQNFEDIILQLVPNAKKKTIDTTPQNLFTHFPTMTDKEFAFLSNISRREAFEKLSQLHEKRNLSKYESKNGIIWISKFDEN